MATCPNCKTSGLSHTLLAEQLPANSCDKCDGLLLSLIAYRRWRELHRNESAITDHTVTPVPLEESQGAKICPKCSGLMTKYRIAAGVSNHLDFCARCEDLWFDRGEWELVQTLAFTGELAKLLTQPWQRRIFLDDAAQKKNDRLHKLLGDEYERFASFKRWLKGHEHRAEIIALLQQPDPD